MKTKSGRGGREKGKEKKEEKVQFMEVILPLPLLPLQKRIALSHIMLSRKKGGKYSF